MFRKELKNMKTVISIDTKLLNQQIALCTTEANNTKDALERDLFTGLENLLSKLSCALENNDEIELKEVMLQRKMTIRELIKYDIDIDVYNNITDDEALCLCCPMELTKKGEEQWHDVLDYVVDVSFEDKFAVCICDDDPNIKWQTKKKRLSNFLWSAAGYCSDKDYDTWFKV